MKKLLVLVLGICVLFAFASCSDTAEETTLSAEETTLEETTAEETTLEEETTENIEVKEETVEEVINFETKKQYSDALNEGTSEVRVKGANGIKEVTYSVTYVDGEETERELVSEKVIKEATAQIIVYGTKKVEVETTAAAPSRPPADLSKYPEGSVVSVQAVDDCDGSGHGYYTITLTDGTVDYQEY